MYSYFFIYIHTYLFIDLFIYLFIYLSIYCINYSFFFYSHQFWWRKESLVKGLVSVPFAPGKKLKQQQHEINYIWIPTY